MAHPFIPVANTASVEFIYSNAGETNENVIHVQKGSPFTLAQLQALRSTCNTWDSTNGLNMRSTSASLVRIRTKALDTNTSPTEDYYLPTPRAGATTGTPLPLNVAICAKLSTGLAGRNNRGRWYVANMGSAWEIDAGHYNLSVSANIVSNLTALLTALTGAGYTWVVTSYYHNGWRAAGVNQPITSIVVVDLNFDSMRKRLPGRGHGP
jgi:hypothetical protein